jgi:biotin carboxyl carrier protein
MKYRVTVGGRTLEVEVTAEPGVVRVDGQPHQTDFRPVPGTPLRILDLDGASWTMPVVNTGPGAWLVQVAGERHEVDVVDERTAHIRSLAGTAVTASGPRTLKAPMPGMVVRVLVEPGQQVPAGASLVVLEAMKMENDLKAPGAAVVEQIQVAVGQTVEKGTVLVTFRP